MNPFLEFVEGICAGIEKARSVSLDKTRLSRTGSNEENASTVLLFSPHPDDECITGLLPLRLMREMGKQIINVPVTYGSNKERQAGRAEELENACGYLGWDISRETGDFQPLEADDVVHTLRRFRPEIIFMPHSGDWNSRHISTHFTVMNALGKMDPGFSCAVVETEFWGAMDDPNLMVDGDAPTVADLVAATSLHLGEVARNPYHLFLPAWLQDNVRRGGELVGGQGGAAPDFSFATLYRLRKWQDGQLVDTLEHGTTVPMNADLSKLFF